MARWNVTGWAVLGALATGALATGATAARAGTDADVTVGMVKVDQGDWAGAVEALERAVSGELAVKAKNLPRAYFGLGRAHAALAAAALGAGDPAGAETHARAAAEALRNGKKVDDGSWGERLASEEEHLAFTFVNLSAGAAGAAGGADDPAWKRAEALAGEAEALQPEFAVAYQLRAQALQGEGKHAEALAEFIRALDVFEAHPPAAADPRMGYAAWAAASLALADLRDPERALALAERGAALVAREKARGAADIAPVAAKVAEDLERMRLEALRSLPERRAEAVAALKQSVEAAPDDATLRMALGQLLEPDDPDAAAAAFAEAQRRAPTRPEPPFLLGALYFNRAVDLQKTADGERDPAKAKALQAQADAAFRSARKPMEDAFALDPTNAQAASALATICVAQRDDSAALEWMNKAKALRR